MRTKTIFFVSILSVVSSLIACDCEPEMPTELNAQTAQTVMSWYFPYKASKTYTFRNNKTGEVWKMLPEVRKSTGEFPEFYISEHWELGMEWLVSVESSFMDVNGDIKNLAGFSCLMTPATLKGDIIRIQWSGHISLTGNRDDLYRNLLILTVDSASAFSYFTDTITLPFIHGNTSLPSNACLHIVRCKGLTDFSLDGESVWERQ